MLRIILFAILIVISGQSLATKIYKWVDENGQIHYSSTKPVNQEVETVKVRKGPKVTAKTATNASDENQQSPTEDDEAEAAAKKQLAAVDVVNRKKQCDLARDNYNALNASIRVVRTNEKGEKVRMSDEERVSALATAQKGIDQYCN